MLNSNGRGSPSSSQLRRFEMDDDERERLRLRGRLYYRQRQSRLTEEDRIAQRERQRILRQAARDRMTDEERSAVRERQRQQRLERRRTALISTSPLPSLSTSNCLHTPQTLFRSSSNPDTSSNPPPLPQPLDEPSTSALGSPNTGSMRSTCVVNNANWISRLEHHCFAEARRLRRCSDGSTITVHGNWIDTNADRGQRQDLRPMSIYDVNFTADWSFGEDADDVHQNEEGVAVQNMCLPGTSPSNRRRHGGRVIRNCARKAQEVHVCERRRGQPVHVVKPLQLGGLRTCAHCNAKLFPYESKTFCCSQGAIKLPLIPAPPELLHLYTTQTPVGIHFRENIRAYNHVFSFTSMGVHLDPRLASGEAGIYTYRAQGSIYHRIGSLFPAENQKPRFLQMYIYDTDHELENRMLENSLVSREVLAVLTQMLNTCNPFVQVFRQISQRHARDNIRLHLRDSTSNRHQYSLPTVSQVAAVLVGGEEPTDVNDRDVIVESSDGRLFNIPDTAGFYDPLQYPLLHPFGTFGWDLNLYNQQFERISTREYYCYMFQLRANHDSILHRGGRLLQQYVVDQYVKISTQNLRFIRDNQKTLRADLYKDLQDSFEAGESNAANVGRKTILPASYIGSPRDMQRRYQDAMALVCKFGKPDLFVTMTCNPNWPEIQDNLLPGQATQDRPDLVTRVFRARCEDLKTDLFKKHVLGKVIAHVHVIEFQKRGLPHAHFLLILDNSDKPKSVDDYDSIIRAEIPDPSIEPDLHRLVLKHMIHGPCGRAFNLHSPCIKNEKCKKHFPKEFTDVTVHVENSYPSYRRPRNGRTARLNNRHVVDNQWVVPYNPWLLMKYGCHLNVEICSTVQCVKYLYKYVYKGVDRVGMEVSAHLGRNTDEIRQFVDARWVCPHEALWRIFAFPLNRMYPAVYSLPVHLQNMHEVTFNERDPISSLINNADKSRTKLTEFFTAHRLNPNRPQYLYSQFPEHYTWQGQDKKWTLRKGNYKVVGRLNSVMPNEGERYHLRVLLLNRKGSKSYDDLKTVQGIRYQTFREAAEKLGLLQSDNLIFETMQEACVTRMPGAIRKLFVIILIHCNPIDVRRLWDEFHRYMLEDYINSAASSDPARSLLADLELSLNDFGKSVKDFDLPTVSEIPSYQPVNNLIIADERSIPIPAKDLQAITQLNNDQRVAFNMIISSIENHSNSVFFVDGPAGTGKTFLYRAILAHVRSQGQIALATASSGIASIMMPGGRTAHSRFKIPIPIQATSMCKITKQSELGALLRETTVIIWDEATMMHRHNFEALDRTLQDLFVNDLPFGGKIVILGGDFRQILPVVTRGTRRQTVNACLIYSNFWQYVQVLKLTQNMRAMIDPVYSELLLNIGNGAEPNIEDDMIRIPDEMVIPWIGQESIRELINSIFPDISINAFRQNYITQRALLTPKNIDVNNLNDQVLDLFPGEEITFFSFDRVENDRNGLYQLELLNSISAPQLPPHKLTLKIGCPMIVLRNLDPKNGVCNGTRVLLRSIDHNIMHGDIMTGSFSGQPVMLPRIPLKASQEDIKMPFALIRNQFPVRLSFALTINKAQGQTIPNIGIYLPSHVFSHGQLYVALSRSTCRRNTKLLIKNGIIEGYDGTYTRNVVYEEVLTSRGFGSSQQSS